MELAAREAELARLEENRLQGMEEARLLSQIEAEERAAYQDRRAQAEQTEQVIKDLIAKAEQALAANDLSVAATLGRKAAIGLLNARGAWTREAAQFALAGSGRRRPRVGRHRPRYRTAAGRPSPPCTSPSVAAAGISEAARAALASDAPEAARNFLTTGLTEARRRTLGS